MSRVGKRVLNIPQGVTLDLNESNHLKVTGPLGSLEFTFSPLIAIKIEDNLLKTERPNDQKHVKQLHGTTNSLISSMLKGVVNYFEKTLIIQGVGYRAILLGDTIELLTGYSHPVRLKIPNTLKVEIPRPTEVIVRGCDKQEVGLFSAKIRMVRKPNPYSGKGISYQNEKIRRKEGKKASK